MITTQNYFEKVRRVDVSSLPVKLKEGYEFVKEVTENHTTWNYYKSDPDIQSAIDHYLAQLSEYLQKHSHSGQSESVGNTLEKAAREAAKKFLWDYVKRGDSLQELKKSVMGNANDDVDVTVKGGKVHVRKVQGRTVNYSFPVHSIYNEIIDELGDSQHLVPKPSLQANPPASTKGRPPAIRISTRHAKSVERVDEEVRFIKRYAVMHGKIKTDVQILNFVNALQRAIVEKRIRKTSAYAKAINYIQESLVKLYNIMENAVEIKINNKVLKRFVEIAGSEKVRLSVNYMKRYISIQGKHITKEKAKRLYTLIASAMDKGKIKGNDPYLEKVKRIALSLKNFAEEAQKDDTLHIPDAILNGISEVLDGCGCCDKKREELDGIEETLPARPPSSGPRDAVMNSMEFAKMQFETLGFMGKWKELIGDPSEGFTAMVFGKPKMGKSYLCIDWAGYLARHHGNTLYVAKEEKLDATLQKKLSDKNVQHSCLYVSDHLPDNLSAYQFIFLDSVNKLGLSPEDFERLKAENPRKSFISIFQTTKKGNFRGANAFQHDVDVVIEIPKKGRALQFGRFNQGGELEVFTTA